MKKIIITLFLITIFFQSLTYANSIIYKKENSTQISSGTNLIEYDLLTEDGWVKAYILKVDTGDEYTDLEVLSSENGVNSLSSVMAMTAAKNAIAGINADFFSGRNGKGHAIGLAINNYSVITSSAEENLTKPQFATLFIDEKNKSYTDYFTNKITIYCGDNKEEIEAWAINRYSSYPHIPTIYNYMWGKESLGKSNDEDVVEILVENNEVIDIGVDSEGFELNEDRYVIRATGSGKEFLLNNLKIGSYVDYKIEFTPNIDNIKFAISGGATLIENGIIPDEFSHNISGRNPRTIIGIDKNEEIFYLIAIDGRTKSSIGMTEEESAEFLKSIGIYTAINLDGGGSTTMVAKKQGDTKLSEINSPSGGQERLVANGVGVISTAPNSEKLYELKIVMDETNIFVGEERKIKVVGYNQYYNAIEINEDDVEWDYTGVDVTIKDGIISGNVVGTSYITAKIGKIKTELEVNILSAVNEIFISPKNTAIVPGNKVSYILQSKNKNGYYAGTDNETYKINIHEYYKDGVLQEVVPNDAIIEDLTFSAESAGTYILSFSKGNCTSFAKVDVGIQKFNVIDDFEKESFYFDPYPDEVGGDAIFSNEQAHSGKYSAKLEYDFDRDAKVRGAYVVLNEPLTIPKDASHLAFWVYNDKEKDEKLKTKIIDGNGHIKLIVLQDNIIHEGWQEIKYSLAGISLPIKITDIYVAQDNENIRESGYIYVDDLGYYTSKIQSDDSIKIPKDIKLEDANNIDIHTKNSFDIAFLDNIEDGELMLDWLKNYLLVKDINQDADLTVFTSPVSNGIKEKFIHSGDVSQIQKDKIKTEIIENKGYDLFSNDKCTILTVDVSQNSIRKSDGTQFENISNDIKDDETGNVILVLNNTLDNFEDLKERRVFVDMLCELKRSTEKNIFVIHDGFFNDFSMERGVKFLSLNNHCVDDLDKAKSSYLVVSIFDNEISYEYRRIFRR